MQWNQWRPALAVVVTGLTQGATVRGNDILTEARVGNRAAIESITSCYCRIETLTGDPPVRYPFNSGQFWRERDHIRSRCGPTGSMSEVFISPRRRLVISNCDSSRPYVSIQPLSNDCACNAWQLGLLTHPGPNGIPFYTFDALLRQRCRVSAASLTEESGRKLIRVQLVHDTNELTFYFDPTVNYLVRKLIVRASPTLTARYPSNRENWSEFQVKEFIEGASGVWFPQIVELNGYVGQTHQTKWVTTFSDVRINTPLPADTFRPKLPRGTVVTDATTMTKYAVDEDGHRIGPEQRFEYLNSPKYVHSLADLAGASGASTGIRSRQWWWWLVLLAIAAGCAWSAYRIRRWYRTA